ncbi:MAG: type III ribulose-bisphosphate carboxylase [Desulfurococcales archaeon]|nr:type III ribulose-bisphosphate carboxylase [Desulfurococcales archaeon]
MGFEWYDEFVREGYTPSDDEVLVSFLVRPAQGTTLRGAAGRIASESSVGTWTTLSTLKPHVRKLMAKAYLLREDGLVKVAYPVDLFEAGSIPQLFSSVLGNIFGMRAIDRLKVLDIRFPESYVKSFKGPAHGIKGVREKLKVYGRPVLATVPKPKVGLTPEEYGEAAYEILAGGMDLVKDDENLTSMSFCKFERRAEAVMKAIDKAEKETGERKGWLANITAETNEMLRRLKLVADYGNGFVMVDILAAGFAGLQTVREAAEDYGLAIHAHRAFHAAFTRLPDHGVSFYLIAKIARLAGVDHIHIGTNVGKMEADLMELKATQQVITSDLFLPPENNDTKFEQRWYGMRPVFPVASGGLHPGVLPQLMDFMGTDIIIQVGGGVTGHPKGPLAGGKAVRQAIEAYLQGISLEEYAEKHAELREALEKWGEVRPR